MLSATPNFRDDHGSVLVMVALWLPILLLFSAFAVDVGNWFTHQRHLQTQADAGALGGGDSWKFPCDNNAIETSARQYAGASASTPGAPYNSQLGGTPSSRIHVLLNSPAYYNQSGAGPQTGYGDAGPCTTGYLDVKLTESNLPWFIFPRLVPAINAHARVSLVQETTRAGSLPVAVPDPGTVTAAAVDFINEDTGAVLGSSNLTSAGGGAYNNSATPVTVNTSSVAHLGVVVKLSGATPAPATLTCGQPLVLCYDTSSANSQGVPSRGVLFVQGYPSGGYTTPGSTGEPSVKSVTLFAGGSSPCPDPYFFYLAPGVSSCTLGVKADVTGANSVSATISDLNGNYSATTALDNNPNNSTTWVTDNQGQAKFFDVPGQDGALNVTLNWTKTSGTYNGNACGKGSSACTGSWIVNGAPFVFQRAMSATDPSSGPLKSAVLNDESGPSSHSYVDDGSSTTHRFWVNLQMLPGLGYATAVSDPPVYLRVEGSQNQTIDCDPNLPNLRQELDFGCSPQYTVNNKTANGLFSVDCSTWPTSNNSWNPPNYAQPWPCVSVQTGGAGGQVSSGIEDRMTRLAGTICPTNNWTSFPNLSGGDPRLVSVILTPFGTFGGSGNTNLPVTGFAEFYVTGWANSSGGKVKADCAKDDIPPGADYIVGHFVRYVDTLNNGGGTTSCNQSMFGICVVVLTQ